MVAIVSPFVILLSLFATSLQNVSNPNNQKRRRTKQQQHNPNNSKGSDRNFKEGSVKRTGRRRYSRSGDKIRNNGNEDNKNGKQQEVYPLPELTTPSCPRPTYFTCRHTYEETLISEIQRYVAKNTDTNNSHEKDRLLY